MSKKQNNQTLPVIMVVVSIVLVIVALVIGVSAFKGNSGKLSQKPAGDGVLADGENNPPPQPSDKDENGCYTPETVRKHYGESDCVDYTVGYTYATRAGTKFLDEKTNYKDGFVGYIPSGSSAAGDISLSEYDGKKIKVTGLIKEYSGYPEIEISDLSQVSVY